MEKLPFVAACFGLNVATTAYALLIMVPMNKRMTALAGELERDAKNRKNETEFRQLQTRWAKLNYGETRFGLPNSGVSLANDNEVVHHL